MRIKAILDLHPGFVSLEVLTFFLLELDQLDRSDFEMNPKSLQSLSDPRRSCLLRLSVNKTSGLLAPPQNGDQTRNQSKYVYLVCGEKSTRIKLTFAAASRREKALS